MNMKVAVGHRGRSWLLPLLLFPFFLLLVGEVQGQEDPPGSSFDTQPPDQPKGLGRIELAAEQVKAAKIQVGPASIIQLPQTRRLVGKSLDPTSLVQQVNDLAAARATLSASRQEYERLKGLHAEERNVSDRLLEAGEAQWRRDKAQLDTMEFRAKAMWGPLLSEKQNIEDVVQGVIAGRDSLIRVEIPVGFSDTRSFEKLDTIEVFRFGETESQGKPEVIGLLPAADPTTLGRGLLVIVREADLGYGLPIEALVHLPDDGSHYASVPSTSLVYSQGEPFVFVEVPTTGGGHNYQRRAVAVKQKKGDELVIQNGIQVGEMVVFEGAQEILSEEFIDSSAEE